LFGANIGNRLDGGGEGVKGVADVTAADRENLLV